jgi:hypothetical protein
MEDRRRMIKHCRQCVVKVEDFPRISFWVILVDHQNRAAAITLISSTPLLGFPFWNKE